jgi:hypothetical protein
MGLRAGKKVRFARGTARKCNAFRSYLLQPDGTFATFEAPGAGTGFYQGTQVAIIDGLNPAGAITGLYVDASNIYHGFLRAPDGSFTTFDAPGAGTGSGQGTISNGINLEDAIAGYYIDANDVNQGFLRTPDGTFTTFDALTRAQAPSRAPQAAASTRKARSRDTTLTRALYGFLRNP